jgi:Cu(I)/Ag(I) efflux system membrane protein CusA/SilA
VLRVRPKAMTVAAILAGLLPILWTSGAGEVTHHRPGGMVVTAPLLSMLVIPAA